MSAPVLLPEWQLGWRIRQPPSRKSPRLRCACCACQTPNMIGGFVPKRHAMPPQLREEGRSKRSRRPKRARRNRPSGRNPCRSNPAPGVPPGYVVQQKGAEEGVNPIARPTTIVVGAAELKNPRQGSRKGSRGGLSNRLPAVLYAQYAFRHRNANWTSFEVPKWYLRIWRAPAPWFRKPMADLKKAQRSLTLFVRLKWMLSSTCTPHRSAAASRVNSLGFINPGRIPSGDGLNRALSTMSRILLKRSDLVVAPLIPVTHYLKH